MTWLRAKTKKMVYTVDTAYTIYTIQNALHCWKHVYLYILLGRVRTLLKWPCAKWAKSWMSEIVMKWVVPLRLLWLVEHLRCANKSCDFYPSNGNNRNVNVSPTSSSVNKVATGKENIRIEATKHIFVEDIAFVGLWTPHGLIRLEHLKYFFNRDQGEIINSITLNVLFIHQLQLKVYLFFLEIEFRIVCLVYFLF